jgi:hypothetical protein
MKHERFREWLYLAISDEIGEDEQRLLNAHLDDCEECRAELDELTRMAQVIEEHGAVEPSGHVLDEARRSLRDALAREPEIGSVLSRVRRSATAEARRAAGRDSTRSAGPGGWFGWLGGFRPAFAGAAALAIGFFVGYLAFGRTATEPAAPYGDLVSADQAMGGPAIDNVRFVDVDRRQGQIEIQYDIVRPVRYRADFEDKRMKRVLSQALLKGTNPGTRLKAMDVLQASQHPSVGNGLKFVLIEALKNDPNPGVRKSALSALQGLPFDDEVKDAYLSVLKNDSNPGLRVAAIDLLAKVENFRSLWRFSACRFCGCHWHSPTGWT